MSTPQLTDRHFADVAVSLRYFAGMGNGGSRGASDAVAGSIGPIINPGSYRMDFESNDAAINTLVGDWQKLNAAAFSTRYGERPAKACRVGGSELTLIETYKALEAIRYNCDGAENAKPSLLASHEKLKALVQVIAQLIVAAMPDYEAAKWFRD